MIFVLMKHFLFIFIAIIKVFDFISIAAFFITLLILYFFLILAFFFLDQFIILKVIIPENLACIFFKSKFNQFYSPLQKNIYKGLKILKFSYFFPNVMLLLSSIFLSHSTLLLFNSVSIYLDLSKYLPVSLSLFSFASQSYLFLLLRSFFFLI